MKLNDILKAKIPFSAALLIIVAAATCTEQIFLQAMEENKKANDAAAIVSLLPSTHGLYSWPSNIKEKVALTGASIPLIPGAKRLTFNNGYAVRYRVDASAGLVANFYRQTLASQGWKATTRVSSNAKLEKLTIAYAENPLSKKTDITYAYAPVNGANVLGVKIAEADTSAPPPPPPTDQPPAPQPTQPQDQSQPIQPQEPQQPQQPIQPNQPMQPQGPNQQPNQPGQNQMDFFRQPMQQFPGNQPNGQYNDQGQMNQGGQMNQNNQMGPGGQQGPSEEDQKKMDERRFQDMKRGLSQFANGAKSMKRSIARVKTAIGKCGVSLPEELTNALAQTDSLVEKIKAAQTADELDEIINDVQDVGSVMQDWGPRMGDLTRLCQMFKQADRDAKQFDRSIKQLESQAKVNKKIDLSELINEYKTAVGAQKDTLAQAKELAKTDPESALSKIEDDFYGNMDNLGNIQMQINTIVNITKGLRDAAREIKNYESQIKTLNRKKIDTSELSDLLGNLKTQVEELKSLVASKAEVEELASKVDEVFSTRQDIQDGLQEYGLMNNMPQISAGSNYNVKVNLPGAFIKSDNNNNDNSGSDGSGFNPGPNNSGANGAGGNGPAGPGL